VTVSSGAAPFDRAVADYDRTFTNTRLGRLLRERVWTSLDHAFGPGDRVLELGCGTGLDAVHLAGRGVKVTATDASAGMLGVAATRSMVSHTDDLVELELVDLASLTPRSAAARWPVGFDGAFSSFGAINCVADRRRLALSLSTVIPPGGRAILVVMGPVALWEVAWHVMHGQLARATRRFHSGAWANVVGGSRIRVWYPSPARLRADVHPWFRVRRLVGVGVALPPSGLSGAMERRGTLLTVADAFDRRVAGGRIAAWLGDHYLMELERV
jgi:SAM-dependent methyltransferase